MKTYKTAIGFLKHLAELARLQDMADTTDWNKLTREEQKLYYEIIASLQNNLADMQILLDGRSANIEIYRG